MQDHADVDSPKVDRVKEIHSIALAEILTKSGDFDLWYYFDELNRIKRRPLSATWLEAYIMICCIGRIRPAKVTGNLNRLRNKLPETEFQLFEKRVRDYLHPIVLTNHKFRASSFSHVDQSPIWAHVQDLTKRLEKEGFEVFLNSGTLLGVTRDQSLIGHDDDVDLAVILNADNAVTAAKEWKRLSAYLREHDLWDEAAQRSPETHKLTRAGDFEVDLFPAWVSDGRMFVYPHTYGELSVDDVLPLTECAVSQCKIPQEPEKMLAVNYGEGWRMPDPLFKFPWATANDNFSEFLEELEK